MAIKLSNLMDSIINGSPQVLNDPHETSHALRVMCCRIYPEAADAALSSYVLGRFQATDVIYEISMHAGTDGAFDGLTNVNLGLYRKSTWSTVPAAIDTDCFLAAADIATAVGAAGQVIRCGALATGLGVFYTTDGMYQQPLWVVGGVAAQPDGGVQYDLALSATSDPDSGFDGAECSFTVYYSTGY